jgi:hypothetical protein
MTGSDSDLVVTLVSDTANLCTLFFQQENPLPGPGSMSDQEEQLKHAQFRGRSEQSGQGDLSNMLLISQKPLRRVERFSLRASASQPVSCTSGNLKFEISDSLKTEH